MILVPPLDRGLELALRRKIDAKAKPKGALGRIEELAVHIGLATGSLQPNLGSAAVVVFAGDHGIVAEGVTAYPSEVTALVSQMIVDGNAGANIAAGAVGAEVFLVNAGLETGLAPHPRYVDKNIGAATRNFLHGPAMTADEVSRAIAAGMEIASDLKSRGFGLLAIGEVGIGNTSSAALLAHALTGIDLKLLVGPGAGEPAKGLTHKLGVLEKSFARAPSHNSTALCDFGGFEIAMMAGAMVGGAAHGLVILVDGFVATAAACAAIALHPNLRDYLLFAHLSPEPGHAPLLHWLNATALLNLEMRLGEGTGAALTIPLVRMAEAMLRDMADLPGAHPA